MNIQRLAPDQLLTDLALETAREAVWQTFAKKKLSDLVIDPQKNVVMGLTGVPFVSNQRVVTALFESRDDGTLITLTSTYAQPGSIDFGRGKKHAVKMTDWLETELRVGQAPAMPVAVEATDVAAPPIALPSGETSAVVNRLVYGTAAVKRGTTVLLYGVF